MLFRCFQLCTKHRHNLIWTSLLCSFLLTLCILLEKKLFSFLESPCARFLRETLCQISLMSLQMGDMAKNMVWDLVFDPL